MRRFISMRTLCAAAIAALLTSNLFLASCNGDEDYEMNGEYTLAEGRMTRSGDAGVGVGADVKMIRKQERFALEPRHFFCPSLNVGVTLAWEEKQTALSYASAEIILPSDTTMINDLCLPLYKKTGSNSGLLPLTNNNFEGTVSISYEILYYDESGNVIAKYPQSGSVHINYPVPNDMFYEENVGH